MGQHCGVGFELVQAFAIPVLRKTSSKVTKVPLAESRRLFVTESKSSEYMERKDGKKMVKCREER